MDLKGKKERLENVIQHYGALLIAFSGGVDSTFLLSVARDILKDGVVAVTGDSPIHPSSELKNAVDMAQKLGVKHIIHPTSEMELPDFLQNHRNRCYICKKSLIKDLKRLASEMGIRYIAHGANMDDLDDYRPGFDAAKEMGVVSPLIEAGLNKADIRMLSKERGLETWEKPAMPCLATRLPYGTPITLKVLKMVGAAENALLKLGFKTCRVRHHGDMARIEIAPADFDLVLRDDIREAIIRGIKGVGYLYVSLDLEGYTQGSMNRPIF